MKLNEVTGMHRVPISLPVVYDADTGNVLLGVVNFVIPLGNVNTGHLYAFRQYRADDPQLADHRAEIAWTIEMAEGNIQQKIETVANMSFLMNMGYRRELQDANVASLGHMLSALTDTHIPALVGGQYNALQLTLESAKVLAEARQGLTSREELQLALERMVAFVSCMPQATVTATIDPEPFRATTIVLPGSDTRQ